MIMKRLSIKSELMILMILSNRFIDIDVKLFLQNTCMYTCIEDNKNMYRNRDKISYKN